MKKQWNKKKTHDNEYKWTVTVEEKTYASQFTVQKQKLHVNAGCTHFLEGIWDQVWQ